MTRNVTQEYFENRKEQGLIKEALSRAIPEGVYYHNLIVALSELTARIAHEAFVDEIKTTWNKAHANKDGE